MGSLRTMCREAMLLDGRSRLWSASCGGEPGGTGGASAEQWMRGSSSFIMHLLVLIRSRALTSWLFCHQALIRPVGGVCELLMGLGCEGVNEARRVAEHMAFRVLRSV